MAMDILTELYRILPPQAVITDSESKRPYECDGLSAYRQLPGVVVLPDTIEQVQAILKLCHRYKTPVVPRGAGTGLSGGALPLAQGVLLSLTKFNRILALYPINRTATVEPRVRNLAISEAVAGYGLYYAPDPSSQIACTIGGNVAENSGGVHCLKYGLTVHNVLGLKVLTLAGDLLEIGGQCLDSPGYDLLSLITGSEGLLGVVVEVTVKLLPKPPYAQVLLAAFDRIESAGAACAAIIACGILPAGLELMDRAATCAVEDFVHAGYPLEAEAILLCELDGIRDEAERRRFWAGRKAAFPAVGRIAADYYCMDGTIPRRHLAQVLSRIGQLSSEYGLPVVNVFHAGDGNLHPLICYDANVPDELDKAEALGSKILELCVEVGGTVTGEHGVGVEKLDQMCVQFSALELSQFHAVKRAFDPQGLLNPGKAIPTLHRCAEWGAMHVHQGRLPFPELERF